MLDEKDRNNSEQADVGDIVRIAGYPPQMMFEVISVTKTQYKDLEVEYEAVEYETTCLSDKRNYYADDAEITIVSRKRRKQAKDGRDKSDSIDELLDELNCANKLIALLGEHEDDEKKDRKYALKRAEIYAKLKEAVGNE